MTTANLTRILTPITGVGFAGTPSVSNHVVDASTEGVAFVFDAKDTNAITHVGFRYGARTGTPPIFIAGIEGVSVTTGFPDGTYKGGGTPASGTFTPPASTAWDGTWQWVALDNSYTPALGERLCIAIRYSSGTIDGSNNSSFTTNWSSLNPVLASFPYAVRNTGGTWTNQTSAAAFGLRTASSRYGAIIPNLYATRSASTVGHRQAMKVNLPAGFGTTYRVRGVRTTASLALATGKTPLAKIWNAGGAIASKAMDTEQIGSATSGAYRCAECIFDTAVDLNFGTDYYFGFEVADATSAGVLIYGTQFASADDNTEDGGSYCCLSTYNGSVWTDDTTVRPWMELILDDITEPSGGGGAFIGPMRVIQSAGRRR